MTDEVTVRVCTADDLDVLMTSAATNDVGHRHHLAQWELQITGQATYLVAWQGSEPVGRGTVLRTSKYQGVIDALGSAPEINALEAFTQGQGIGTKLIAGAEAIARQDGSTFVGIAVETDNDGARRLYDQLGYQDWGGGHVVDVWSEADEHGKPTVTHHDACWYLIKGLAGA